MSWIWRATSAAADLDHDGAELDRRAEKTRADEVTEAASTSNYLA
jgi:hypothetical protein